MAFAGACHCGAVAYTVDDTPRWLTDCNCSTCRRFAALWFHTSPANVTLTAAADATLAYAWNDRVLAFHTCRTCGCMTHWAPLNGDDRMAVNLRMADPDTIRDIRIRHFDGADTWAFLD